MSAQRPASAVAPGRPGSEIYPTSPLGERIPGLPTGRDVPWEPLVDYRRNGVSETTIHGAVAWATGGRVVHSFGGNVLCYGRSMMKPLTMKVFADLLEPHLNWQQRAISVASHNGDTEHVAAAQSILDEAEWGLMQTPLDVPLVQFGRQVRRPRRWYHCCSGEHAGILQAAAGLKGWNAGWLHDAPATHSSPRTSRTILRRFLGEDWVPRRVARDGCGLPRPSATPWASWPIIFAGHGQAPRRGLDLGGHGSRARTWWAASTGSTAPSSRPARARCSPRRAPTGCSACPIVHDGLPRGTRRRHQDRPRLEQRRPPGTSPGPCSACWASTLRNPYPLHRQKAFLVPGVVPPDRLEALEQVPTWDEWDPNDDRWYYDWTRYAGGDRA